METIILLLGICAAAYVVCRIILLLIEISLWACLLFVILVALCGIAGVDEVAHSHKHPTTQPSPRGDISL